MPTPALTYPGVYLVETAPVVHQIVPATTNVTAFVGVFPSGPSNQAVYVTSWDEFASMFGGLDTNWEVTYAVWQFFQGGGLGAFIVRLVSTTPTAVVASLKLMRVDGDESQSVAVTAATTTAITFSLYPEPGGQGTATTVDVTVTADDAATVVAAINAAQSPAASHFTADVAGPGPVATGTAVDFTADLGASATVGPVTLTANSLGASGNGMIASLTVAGGAVPNPNFLNYTLAQPGPSGLQTLEQLAGLPANNLTQLAQLITQNSNYVTAVLSPPAWSTTATTATLANGADQGSGLPAAPPTAASAPLGPFSVTAKTPGAAANGWVAEVTLDANDPQVTFTLLDKAGGTALETLSALPADAVSLAAAINTQSTHVEVAMSAALEGGENAVWDPTSFTSAVLTELADDPNPPATGAPVPMLDQIAPAVFNLMCVPDVAWLPLSNQSVVLTAALNYCQSHQAFLLVDPPPPAAAGELPTGLGGGAASLTIDAVGNPMNLQKLLGKWGPLVLSDENIAGATYYPWVQIADPANQYLPKWVPPSGSVAGAYATSDQAVGVWKAPAGTTVGLKGVLALADMTITDSVQGELNPRGINCLRTFASYPNIVWGARTLAGDDLYSSPFKYVSSRRLADFVEQSLIQSLKWAVFEPNDADLWAAIVAEVMPFMTGLYAQGAFFGATAAAAYYVVCDATTTTLADALAGVVNVNVGFQPVLPAEFVVLNVQVGGLTPAAS